MRSRLSWITLLGVGLLAWPALAQTPEKPADEPPADSKSADSAAMKQKLLDNFDTNKDGTIDHSEARAIGRALREHFDVGPPGRGGRGPGDRDSDRHRNSDRNRPEGRRRPDGPPPRDGRGPEGRRARGPDDGPGDRGPESRGAGRPEGPPGPPNPERLFNRFDENKDGSLSLDEFKELTGFMRERMAARGPRGPGLGGPGFERRGPGGPPPRGGDFERRGGEGRRRGGWREGPPPGPDGPPPPADPPAAEDVDHSEDPV